VIVAAPDSTVLDTEGIDHDAARRSRDAVTPSPNGSPLFIEPDLAFIRALTAHSGTTLKKCMQCGTCSATCDLSPDDHPFPRKEMAWVAWGMKEPLMRSSDVWLCHQCQDCSTRCPRGARPGDVLAAIRQECIRHYALPRIMGRWAGRAHGAPILLGIPAALLTAAIAMKDPIAEALGLSLQRGEQIVFAYSHFFPHWLLNALFGLFTLLALAVLATGTLRFWRAMKSSVPGAQIAAPVKGRLASIGTVLSSVVSHEKFAECTKSRARTWSHLLVTFGFVALTLVTIWVITARYNPLIRGEFVYPFGFWNPWKMLANLGGVAILAGCLMMIRDRLRDSDRPGGGSYFDWALIASILLVVLSGFATEVLHYLRLEPHRHLAYFVHLTLVLMVLIYLPYSKLAHVAYRGAALVFAERYGRHDAARGRAGGEA
jgi:quinone-modifying oxidoreductase subunit QmoC